LRSSSILPKQRMLKLTVAALLSTSSLAMLTDNDQQTTSPPPQKGATMHCCYQMYKSGFLYKEGSFVPGVPGSSKYDFIRSGHPNAEKLGHSLKWEKKYLCRKDGTNENNPDNVGVVCPKMSEKTGEQAARTTHIDAGDALCEVDGAEGSVTECHVPQPADSDCGKFLDKFTAMSGATYQMFRNERKILSRETQAKKGKSGRKMSEDELCCIKAAIKKEADDDGWDIKEKGGKKLNKLKQTWFSKIVSNCGPGQNPDHQFGFHSESFKRSGDQVWIGDPTTRPECENMGERWQRKWADGRGAAGVLYDDTQLNGGVCDNLPQEDKQKDDERGAEIQQEDDEDKPL